MEIAKAEEALTAADLCCSQGLYNSSGSRAYDAMFQVTQVPSPGLRENKIEELEGKIAERWVNILVDTGILPCSAVYEPDA
jgi:hypothetical protein